MRSLAFLVLVSCGGRGDAPVVEPPEPQLRRLTRLQYTNSVHDALGAAIVVPTSLEPDELAGGLFSVGASLASISPRGVEQYETAAYAIANQVVLDPAMRARSVPCEPVATRDDDCAARTVELAGRRLWRRSLSEAEVAALVDIAGDAATALGTFDQGLEYALAAMLQSPNFLFRVELGEADPDGGQRFTSHEMAVRLSFLLWNTTPDDALLEAAERGDLVTDEGLSAQVDRLIADPRARTGVSDFFTEMLHLHELDALNKDPVVFTHMSAEVGPSAREETLRVLDGLVFDDDGDLRDFIDTRHTQVDRKLAAIYGVRAPELIGFGPVELPEEGGRRGFLGQVSFLALAAHPANTSVTLRGKYVREVLLCQPIPTPPADLNTAIPEASPDAPTMRDRVDVHLSDPMCASCHEVMDNVGLGFENFDGLGGWRDTENGFPIDASGELDGEPYADAVGLAGLLHGDENLTRCIVRTYLQYGAGHVLVPGESDALDWHHEGFADAGYSLRAVMRDVAMNDAFRAAGEVTP